MSDELRRLREVCEAGDEEARLRTEVQAWMTAEAERGCLRYNRDAPMWHAYEAAAAHQQRAGATLVSVWPEMLAVVEAAHAADEDCHGPGGRMWEPGCACTACSQMRALDALDAAIRRSMDGAR